MAVGIPLGILVGFVSSAAFVLFLRMALVAGEALKAGGSLLAMPASWFGGGWLTQVFDFERIDDAYVISLALTVLVICSFPMARIVIRIGREVGGDP